MVINLTDEQKKFMFNLLSNEKQRLDLIENHLNTVISEVLNVDESIDVSGIFNVIGHIEQKQDHVSNLLFRLSSESMENIDSLNTL